MSKNLLRYLRMHFPFPQARPIRHRDGVLAVAAINESAELATLLIADMSLWKRGHGTSATNAIDVAMVEAHAALIEGFGLPLAATRVVEWDSADRFDLYCDLRDGKGYLHYPLVATTRAIEPRSRGAFLSWAPGVGHLMLEKAELVGRGEYAGVEG